VTRAGGGAAGGLQTGGSAGTGQSGVNKGGGGNGGDSSNNPGNSGVVILRYPSSRTIVIGAGLTGTTAPVSTDKVTTITQGTGNVSWV
jgi:hypothetical protein